MLAFLETWNGTDDHTWPWTPKRKLKMQHMLSQLTKLALRVRGIVLEAFVESQVHWYRQFPASLKYKEVSHSGRTSSFLFFIHRPQNLYHTCYNRSNQDFQAIRTQDTTSRTIRQDAILIHRSSSRRLCPGHPAPAGSPCERPPHQARG